MNRLKKASLSTLTSAIQQLTTIICGLILPRLILRAYGSAYNGIVSSITQYLSVISLLQAGVQGSTRVALYKTLSQNDKDATNAVMRANTQYYHKVAICLAVYIVILAVIFPLLIHNNEISKTDIILLVIIMGASDFLQYFFGNAYKALLTADQSVYIINILQTITVICNTAICSFIIFADGSIVMAKLGSAVVYGLNPIVLYIYVRWKYNFNNAVAPDKTALKGRWDVLANSIANFIHENVDIVFITIFCDIVEVSVYSVYHLVSSGLNRLMTIFTSGMEAAFGNMWALNETDTLKRSFCLYEYIMYTVSIFLSGCMMVLIIPFVTLYTKGINDVNYVRPVFAFLLSIAVLTLCMRTPYVTIVQAAGHYKETKMGSFAEAGINLALTFALVIRLGIVGAIVGTVVANIFRTIQYGYYVANHLVKRRISEMWIRMIWAIITLFVCVLVSNFVVENIIIEGWIGWLAKAFSCALIHILILGVSSLICYYEDFTACIALIKRIL